MGRRDVLFAARTGRKTGNAKVVFIACRVSTTDAHLVERKALVVGTIYEEECVIIEVGGIAVSGDDAKT